MLLGWNLRGVFWLERDVRSGHGDCPHTGGFRPDSKRVADFPPDRPAYAQQRLFQAGSPTGVV
jgi:hypothetical protein